MDAVGQACTVAVAGVITEDTGLDRESAFVLAAGLTGAAQVAARWWLTQDGTLDRPAAEDLVASLAWRGIGGFPRADVDPVD